MKSYKRIVKRRVEAALRIRMRDEESVAPVADRPADPVPVEVIDLATAPFTKRFPDMPLRRSSRKKPLDP